MKPLDIGSREWSPEIRLLLFCCRPAVSREGLTGMKNMIGQGFDWKTFSRLAVFHRVVPVVTDFLDAHLPGSVPPGAPAALKRAREYERLRSLKLMGETVRLAKLLEKNGITAVFLKGPVLALQLYGDVSLREAGDIDILVHEKDLDRIHRIMRENRFGVHPRRHEPFFSSATARKNHMKRFNHINFKGDESEGSGPKARIECHYRLFNNPAFFPLHMENIRDRLQVFEYAGTRFHLLPPYDEILYLLAHGAVHQWYHLKWLLDISRLCVSATPDWERLFAGARHWGLERAAAQGLLLSRLLLDTPRPANLRELRYNERITAKLTRTAARIITGAEHRMLPQREFFSLERKPYLLRLKKDPGYKVRQLKIFLNPGDKGKTLRFPRVLSPIYHAFNSFLRLYRGIAGNRGEK